MLQEFIKKASLRLKTFFQRLKNQEGICVIDKGFAETESVCSMLEQMDPSSLEEVDADIIANLDTLVEGTESTLYSSLAHSLLGTLEQYRNMEEDDDVGLSEKVNNIVYAISSEDFSKIDPLLVRWKNIKEFYQAEYFNFRKEIENTSPIFLSILQTIEELAHRSDKEQRIENIKKRISDFTDKVATSKEILLSSNFSFMSPYDFEEFVARLFKKLGYNTIITSKTGDYGVDVIAENSSEKIAIQCKKYHEDNTVGNQTVQMLLGAMQLQGLKADKGIIITTSSFTKQAYKQAEGNNIELWDRNILHKAVKKHLIDI